MILVILLFIVLLLDFVCLFALYVILSFLMTFFYFFYFSFICVFVCFFFYFFFCFYFFFSSRRRHTRCSRDWSSDVCSSDLHADALPPERQARPGDPPVHQLARRRRRRHAGDLRRHEVPQLPDQHILHRPRRERRGDRLHGRHQGQTLHPAQRQGHDPPAVRRRVRSGGGHRNPGGRD